VKEDMPPVLRGSDHRPLSLSGGKFPSVTSAAELAANAASKHWPTPPDTMTKSPKPLIRRKIAVGEMGSDGRPLPSRPGVETPSNVLWIRISNMKEAVTLGTLYELFNPHGKIQKIVLFENRLSNQDPSTVPCQQAFVQYLVVQAAARAWCAVDAFE